MLYSKPDNNPCINDCTPQWLLWEFLPLLKLPVGKSTCSKNLDHSPVFSLKEPCFCKLHTFISLSIFSILSSFDFMSYSRYFRAAGPSKIQARGTELLAFFEIVHSGALKFYKIEEVEGSVEAFLKVWYLIHLLQYHKDIFLNSSKISWITTLDLESRNLPFQ